MNSFGNLVMALSMAASSFRADRCDKSAALDIMFVVDSSGSVFDPQFQQWRDEIELVANIVQDSLPTNSRAGLINFSGCSYRFDLDQCIQAGRLEKMIALNDYGSPNDLQALHTAIEAIGPDDFLGGYTWTDEALQIALDEFNTNSHDEAQKMIVLITDGEPYPYGQGHEPCNNSPGYVSPTMQSLEELDVVIIAVGIDITPDAIANFFECMVDEFGTQFFDVADFAALAHLGQTIGDAICDELISVAFSSTDLP